MSEPLVCREAGDLRESVRPSFRGMHQVGLRSRCKRGFIPSGGLRRRGGAQSFNLPTIPFRRARSGDCVGTRQRAHLRRGTAFCQTCWGFRIHFRGNARGTAALIEFLDHDLEGFSPSLNTNVFAGAQFSRWLDASIVDAHMSGFDRGARQAASLVKTRSPQPFVDAQGRVRLELHGR